MSLGNKKCLIIVILSKQLMAKNLPPYLIEKHKNLRIKNHIPSEMMHDRQLSRQRAEFHQRSPEVRSNRRVFVSGNFETFV